MNFSQNLNIIIPIIVVIVIVISYYSYYSVKDMVKSEIKDFYINTEKIKIRRDRKDKIPENRQTQFVNNQNIHNNQEIQELRPQPIQNQQDFDMNDMSFLEMENNDDIDINNLDIESYVDPLKNEDENQIKYNKKEENTTNQILADRIFNL